MSTSRKIAGASVMEWKVAGVIGAVGTICLVYLFASGKTTAEDLQQKERKAAEVRLAVASGSALMNCKRELKKSARDPETAQIPDVSPLKGGSDWRFLWAPDTQQVRMRNGLGLEVAVGAFCVVDESTGKIKLLTLDGQQLITPTAS